MWMIMHRERTALNILKEDARVLLEDLEKCIAKVTGLSDGKERSPRNTVRPNNCGAVFAGWLPYRELVTTVDGLPHGMLI
jgi:hypothetical protein